MADLLLLANAAAVGAVLGLAVLHALTVWIITDNFRQRLKDDVGRLEALRHFPRYVVWEYRNRVDWWGVVRYSVKATFLGAVAGVILAIFGVGFLEVLG